MLRAQRALADSAAPGSSAAAAPSWILWQRLRELCSPEESSGSSPLELGSGVRASARAQRRKGRERREEQREATSCSSGSSEEVCSPRSRRNAALETRVEGLPTEEVALADGGVQASVLPGLCVPAGTSWGAEGELQQAGPGCCGLAGIKRSVLSPGLAGRGEEDMAQLALQKDTAAPDAGTKRARTDAAVELPSPKNLALLLLLRHSVSPAKLLQQGQRERGREDDKGSCIQRRDVPVCSIQTRSDGSIPGSKARNNASEDEYESVSRSDMSIVESLFNEEDRSPRDDEASSR